MKMSNVRVAFLLTQYLHQTQVISLQGTEQNFICKNLILINKGEKILIVQSIQILNCEIYS
jgi:hypothetical protein